MRSKTTLVLAVLLSSALLVTGCAKPPQAELDAAKAVLAEADGAKAATYASAELAAANEALNAAQAEIDTQNNKFALFRSYKKAVELLTDASNKAKAAKDAAVANMEKAKGEAQAAIDAAKAAVASAQTEMATLEGCKRKPKGFAADMTLLKGTLDGIVAELPGVESAFGSEDYLNAKSQAEGLTSRANTLVTDLQGAKTKINC
jgi:chromosome segregation ATPase